jgi:putative tryptophan/tyrosine transport system substrate-binding protein
MKRREFIAGIGVVSAWSLTAAAQPPTPARMIGMLMGSAADDLLFQRWFSAFSDGLRALGWVHGRNIHIEPRTAGGDLTLIGRYAAELVSLRPDVMVAYPTPAAAALSAATRDIPIVFVNVADPLGSGFVETFAQPGRNITGFTNFEPTMGSKWLELLREVAPQLHRVAMLFNPETAASGARGGVYLTSIEAAAQSLGLNLSVIPVRAPADIDSAFASLAREPGGGMLVMPNLFILLNRQRIIAAAAEHRVPTVYPQIYFADEGGLAAYSVDVTDLFRRASSYVDRILRGTKPGELPVQAPTKFELVINLKTAKALGLNIPPTLLARADEVIE